MLFIGPPWMEEREFSLTGHHEIMFPLLAAAVIEGLDGKERKRIMPIYEYQCGKCDEEFEALVFRADEAVACPECKGDRVKRLMSVCGYKSGESLYTLFGVIIRVRQLFKHQLQHLPLSLDRVAR